MLNSLTSNFPGIVEPRNSAFQEDDWFPGSRVGCSQVHGGVMAGSGYLIDNLHYQDEILAAVENKVGQQVQGGDMEAHALAKTAGFYAVKKWAVVKGIADWADGRKHKSYQPFAAAMAVRFVQVLLNGMD